mmetsp:Transcript_29746/g.81482  ORF Transcript_29746/g.81482 Transcript_29746/m.81482 type:complete len:462 (+) Transcript_29746:81-1466(+)|eukprot:CAMPEP_0117496740 /NCGR_PEP_ID=MMETSP0784-20121206/20815_1 /TAXON_ID=39447 /ORGANISM="" /LENGTH=461 /DNA_ID=CAMNT_0005291725 /DNA_START=81 /DNA_END=1469 /DNA_ORIENTATION=+
MARSRLLSAALAASLLAVASWLSWCKGAFLGRWRLVRAIGAGGRGSGITRQASGVIDTHALPPAVYWGRPAAEALPEALEKLGAKRAFLMVSSSLRKNTSVVRDLERSLGSSCVGVWDGMPSHSPRAAVMSAARAARAAQADVIVTLGGGSLTDGAKVVRVAIAENVTQASGLDAFRYTPGDEKAGNPLRATPLMQQITIPTTLSAGEFTWFAGCTNEAKKDQPGVTPKENYLYPAALPAAIILDPAMAEHTPSWLLLSTGLRSVDHCVEALCSLAGNPYSDTMLKGALKLLVSGLRRIKVDPSDREAALDCQMAIFQTVQGCQSGPKCGASHAIGHILGGAYDVPHGYTTCVALPAVLEWNSADPAALHRQRLVREVFEELAAEGGDEAAARAARAKSASEHVRDLVSELGLPGSLREVGLKEEQLDDCSRRTMEDRLVDTSPRPISGWQDVRKILDLCW